MPADAPDQRPTATNAAAATMETGAEQQTEHLISGQAVRGVVINVPDGATASHVYSGSGELLAKVFPGGAPLVATCWTCPTCGLSIRGAPPRRCINEPATPGCPVEPTP